ncbi:MAG: hypothetical protein JXB10_18990 [Pirellulales bacterium]|nr:hypothetical protein [Pirellulales bacterium]
MKEKISLCVSLIFTVFLLGSVTSLRAQRIAVDAVAGEPFGVGKIVVDLPKEMLPQPLGVEGLALTDPDCRLLYPTVDAPGFGKILREFLDAGTPLTSGGPVRHRVGGILRGFANRPQPATIYFLFRGQEPLHVTLHARQPLPITITPRPAPAATHRLLLEQWWRQYTQPPGLLEQKPDYPPLVENYLATMLERRLNLQRPPAQKTSSPYDELERELGLTLGTEKFRVALQRARLLGEYHGNQPADQPLPPPLEAPPLRFPETAQDVPIEPMAMRVPEECFYVRFGSFGNFLWMQDTLERWGGDAQNLVALRGLDLDSRGRIERQLILKQTALSRMLGPTVVADVAVLGTDLFFREGASYGFLFQAKNNFLFGNNIKSERQARVKQGGVEEKTIKIDGKEVSYIFSADGTVRSYYAADGNFHLFATSRRLVERFLQTGKGIGSLGKSEEFRHARSMMPLSREDTVFVYFSDAFFRNFTSPHYRVEMARRLQAMADVELVQLAKLAAASEGKPGATIEDLKRYGFLPEGFGPLPDGSRIVLHGGDVIDDHRGRRSGFLPIPDVPVGKITAFELAEYQRFADFYSRQWGRIDPILVGVKRTKLPSTSSSPSPPAPLPKGEGRRELVVVDALMTPFATQHFDMLRKYAGLPDAQRIAPVPGNLAAFDFVMPTQHIFGGLRDFGPPPRQQFGRLLPLGQLRNWLIGYLGTSGDLGPLRFLNLAFSSPDAYGFAFTPLGGGWRRQFGPFTVFSFQHEVLAEVTPQIRFVPAERPAQLWLRIDDPTSARIMPLANNWAYHRTRETSLNNLRLMNALEQQLHVPPAGCKEAAEFLLDAKLICPLGGQYVMQKEGPDYGRWTSTALAEQTSPESLLFSPAPPGYQAPPWNWFRGLKLDARMTEKNVSAHAEILMQLPEKK